MTVAPTLFLTGKVALHAGDCLDILRAMLENSVDSVVTDPPYHLTSIVKRFGAADAAPCKEGKTGAYSRASRGFMGKQWDGGDIAFRPELWAEVLRVLKPGGYVVAFGGTRTYHRLACAIEDAGFDVRDMVSWIFGSGFPKSHDVSKGIDKAAGATREIVGRKADPRYNSPATATSGAPMGGIDPRPNSVENYAKAGLLTAASTEAARQWEGWGTALKPALEPICLARKPLSEGTVAANVLRWGTGALNIDGCRVEADWENDPSKRGFGYGFNNEGYDKVGAVANAPGVKTAWTPSQGRWPANVVTDGSDEVVEAFPQSKGFSSQTDRVTTESNYFGAHKNPGHREGRGDDGSAARYFYSAKADSDDRIGSKHPTVKPVDLMRWLVRLVTPPGGTALDPFAGTGTTGEAAWREGFKAVLIEREAEYQADIARRMALCLAGPDERARASIKARFGDLPAGPLFDMIAKAAAE